MNETHWRKLLAVLAGETLDPIPVGFIIDSPWLPNWAGNTLLDYYTSERCWFDANHRVHEIFPDVLFLPGFWAEWGMCTEPSAFGAKCSFPENEFPFAEKVAEDLDFLLARPLPNPATDGLLPFVLARLRRAAPILRERGHRIRFAVTRGPLNIAGFLLGNTELLLAMKMEPDKAHTLIERVNAFLVSWIKLQAHAFPDIDGILLLDDLVGFCGPAELEDYAVPCLKESFQAIDASVRFFHNDAHGLLCAPLLESLGVNLFNFSHEHDLVQMRDLTGEKVALVGNIPPRDVLAQGSPDIVREHVGKLLHTLQNDPSRVVLSCGGGMPPGVSTENLNAFLEAAGYAVS